MLKRLARGSIAALLYAVPTSMMFYPAASASTTAPSLVEVDLNPDVLRPQNSLDSSQVLAYEQLLARADPGDVGRVQAKAAFMNKLIEETLEARSAELQGMDPEEARRIMDKIGI